jgi:hypothetical protein
MVTAGPVSGLVTTTFPRFVGFTGDAAGGGKCGDGIGTGIPPCGLASIGCSTGRGGDVGGTRFTGAIGRGFTTSGVVGFAASRTGAALGALATARSAAPRANGSLPSTDGFGGAFGFEVFFFAAIRPSFRASTPSPP